MNESKALLGLPSEFTLAGVRVRVYQPNIEWVLLALGQMEGLGLALHEMAGGKGMEGLGPFVGLILGTVKLPWYLGWRKLHWFRRLNATQQIHFFEQWLEAVDIKGIKDCFHRAGKAVGTHLNTP